MTVSVNPNEFLWCEKYRPAKIKDVLMPTRIREEISSYIKDGQIPHLIMTGTPGLGKTTVAYAIANEIGADLLFINASMENGVDTIRNKVIQFASTASFEGNLKIIFMDEADKMTKASQDMLRPITEEFSQNTRFIFTGNYKNQFSDALQSRCTPIDLSIRKEEKEEMTMKAWKRCMEILTNENITFDKKTVASIVTRYYPDMRRVMNALQKASTSGRIDEITLSESIPTDKLYESMRNKKFGEVRKWVAENSGDYQDVFRDIYEQLLTLFAGPSIPQVVMLLDQYQDRMTRVADQEITMMACLTEIMASVEWKTT